VLIIEKKFQVFGQALNIIKLEINLSPFILFFYLDICHKKFYITRSMVIDLRPLDGHCYKL